MKRKQKIEESREAKVAEDKDKKPKKFKYTTLDDCLQKCSEMARRENDPKRPPDNSGIC